MGQKMRTTENDVKDLENIGLSNAEARVYLALAGLGQAKASTIWRNSKTSRQDIYRILNELQSKGFIEKIIASPAQFKIIPIQDVLSCLLRHNALVREETEKRIKKLIQKFENNYGNRRTVYSECEFELLRSAGDNFDAVKNLLEETKESLDIIDYWMSFKHVIVDYGNVYMKLKSNVRFITDKPCEGETIPKIVQTLKKKNTFKLKFITAPPPSTFVIVDKKQVRVGIESTNYATRCPALISNNSKLVGLLQDYFELLWSNATEENT